MTFTRPAAAFFCAALLCSAGANGPSHRTDQTDRANAAQSTPSAEQRQNAPAAKEITARWNDRNVFSGGGERPEGRYMLWYRQSAKVWEEALPVGNGHLGAMVFGGVTDERIQVNDNTLWDGYSLDPNDPQGAAALPEVQRLLFEGKNNEAVALASRTMMGRPSRIKPYQSLGEVWIETPVTRTDSYVRSLDLSTGVTSVRYTAGGVRYTREVFASAVDDVIVVRMTADRKRSVSFSMTLGRAENASTVAVGRNTLLLEGRLPRKDAEGRDRGMSFAMRVDARADGGSVRSTIGGRLHLYDGTHHLIVETRPGQTVDLPRGLAERASAGR